MDLCEVEKKRIKYHIFLALAALAVFCICLSFIFAVGMRVTGDESDIVAVLFIIFLAAGGMMAVLSVIAETQYIEARQICCPKCRRNFMYNGYDR
jgi:hypothetical protein